MNRTEKVFKSYYAGLFEKIEIIYQAFSLDIFDTLYVPDFQSRKRQNLNRPLSQPCAEETKRFAGGHNPALITILCDTFEVFRLSFLCNY